MEERELGLLILGWVAGLIVAGGLALNCFGGKKEITTRVKITPEWRLVTDGKKIDTLFIYKQK